MRSNLRPTRSAEDRLLRCFGGISAPGGGSFAPHRSLPVPVTGPNTVSGLSRSTFTNAPRGRHCHRSHCMNGKVRRREIEDFALTRRAVELVLKPSLTVTYCLCCFGRYKPSTFSQQLLLSIKKKKFLGPALFRRLSGHAFMLLLRMNDQLTGTEPWSCSLFP